MTQRVVALLALALCLLPDNFGRLVVERTRQEFPRGNCARVDSVNQLARESEGTGRCGVWG
jgi:hypothetical protein